MLLHKLTTEDLVNYKKYFILKIYINFVFKIYYFKNSKIMLNMMVVFIVFKMIKKKPQKTEVFFI